MSERYLKHEPDCVLSGTERERPIAEVVVDPLNDGSVCLYVRGVFVLRYRVRKWADELAARINAADAAYAERIRKERER